MTDLRERIAYLKGLTEGLGLENNTKEGKILTSIIDVLDDMAESIDEIFEYQDEQEQYLEALDEDLGDLEVEVYGEEGEDGEEDYFEDELEGDLLEVECPKCHDIVSFESTILEDDDVIEVICPSCDEVVYVNDDIALTDDENDE